MMRLLQKNGWTLIKITGSHHRFKKEGWKEINVPVHGKKELDIGTERDILKQANLLHYWKDSKGGKK